MKICHSPQMEIICHSACGVLKVSQTATQLQQRVLFVHVVLYSSYLLLDAEARALAPERDLDANFLELSEAL
jgi:hypothetical protein